MSSTVDVVVDALSRLLRAIFGCRTLISLKAKCFRWLVVALFGNLLLCVSLHYYNATHVVEPMTGGASAVRTPSVEGNRTVVDVFLSYGDTGIALAVAVIGVLLYLVTADVILEWRTRSFRDRLLAVAANPSTPRDVRDAITKRLCEELDTCQDGNDHS